MHFNQLDTMLLRDFLNEPNRAYINGVITSHSKNEYGDKAINEKYPNEFSDGLLYGLGLSDEEYEDFLEEHTRKVSLKQYTVGDRWMSIIDDDDSLKTNWSQGIFGSKWEDLV